MKKSIPSNPKIKCILISILFSVLFIFTALNISNPITAYATGGILQSTPNGKAVNGKEVDSTSTAGDLFWAASEDRTGILFYVIDNTGNLYGGKKLLIMDDISIYRNASRQENFTLLLKNEAGLEIGDSSMKLLTTPSGYSTKPVTYSDGWHATGNVNTLLNSTTTLRGEEVPYWFYYASILIGTEGATDIIMNDILASDSHWAIVAEPVSIQYIYSNSTYSTGGKDTLGHEYSAGDPLPAGSNPNSTSATPYIFCGTAKRLAQAQIQSTYFNYSSPNPDNGGIYTYKFLNMALPWSMCLEHDQAVALWAGGYGSAFTTWQAPTGNGEQLSERYQIAYPTYATGIYFIDVSVMRPPIHTFGGSTPGNTETPSPDKATDGDCTIKKLYYTQIISSDGTILTEATDYHHFEQSGTTNYISIDTEEDYEIEGWKTSGSSSSLTTKEQFTSISASRNGSSSETITLDADTGEKYLYVLLKKTEIDDTPHEDYDFRLEQSQITKRVTFLEGMGPANTPDLITHNFTWTAPAPTITSCTAHGGYGHHLKCDKVWDTEPVEGVRHNHADHSDEISYYACGYTYSCSAGCTKSHTHHTHSDSCIGYKKLTHTTLCPSGCTTRHTHHFSHTDSCYTVCNKVWDVAPVKR